MRSSRVEIVAFVAVGIAFISDALTQQSLMVALIYGIPIAFAALTPSRRLTKVLVISALVLDVAAAVIDASREQHWNVVALEDRVLVTVSIVLTGLLTLALQVRNENARLVRIINELVDAIAHDVRTPLAALSMTLGQAADSAFGDLPVSIDDLQRMAETLLMVARYESGIRQNDRELVSTLSASISSVCRSAPNLGSCPRLSAWRSERA
jgi:signal transduction histidine kinase